jgi:hypothetical protein
LAKNPALSKGRKCENNLLNTKTTARRSFFLSYKSIICVTIQKDSKTFFKMKGKGLPSRIHCEGHQVYHKKWRFSNMKKFLTILLVAALALSTIAALASDAPHGSNFIDENKDGVCDLFAAGKSYGAGLGFVDANGDGVCDNCANVRQARGRGSRQRFVDENGDGVCDLLAAGKSYGAGLGFVDANGDGVCDNCANVRQARGRGSRQRFVDENGDGVCDLLAVGKAFGKGRGFVDEDGDGVCDNCLNNGVRPLDGTGRKLARRNQSQKQQAESGQGQSSNQETNQGRSQGRGQGRGQGQGRNRK